MSFRSFSFSFSHFKQARTLSQLIIPFSLEDVHVQAADDRRGRWGLAEPWISRYVQ